MKDDRLYLLHILESIQLIEEYTIAGRDAFLSTRLLQDGVIRNFEVIGEATRNISNELRQKYSDVPWKEMAEFRNFLIHVYWAVKAERVWDIVKSNVPPLKIQIQAMLDDQNPQPPKSEPLAEK